MWRATKRAKRWKRQAVEVNPQVPVSKEERRRIGEVQGVAMAIAIHGTVM